MIFVTNFSILMNCESAKKRKICNKNISHIASGKQEYISVSGQPCSYVDLMSLRFLHYFQNFHLKIKIISNRKVPL